MVARWVCLFRTHRPFDLVSLTKDGTACEDAHNTAALGDKLNLLLGQIDFLGQFPFLKDPYYFAATLNMTVS